MKLLNVLTKITECQHAEMLTHEGISILLRVLSPIAPHLAHHLWQALHYPGAILDAPWPTSNVAAMKVDEIELVVQINGKLRTRITVASDANEKSIQDTAINDAKEQQSLTEKTVKKIITVPGRIVNIVTD